MKTMEKLRGYTTPISRISPEDFYPLVELAIEEDAPEGDITTESIFSGVARSRAVLVSRENGILAGICVLEAIQKFFPEPITVDVFMRDGAQLIPGKPIASIVGSTRTVLRIERILLNFLQYLSGIASKTHELVTRYPGLRILDTRKTLPGYRKLVKYAVHTGGGWNHRIHLSDMAMIKDNHIQSLGSITNAVASIRKSKPNIKIELEIDSLDQLDEALASLPEIVLLDNFSLEDTLIAVDRIRREAPSIIIEASGGITPEKLRDLERIGGIGVSMGYLTHTTRFLDIGLDMEDI